MLNLNYILKYKIENGWDMDNLKKEFIVKTYDKYLLIKYKKDLLDSEYRNELSLFRSVVLDNNKIVCISPPKSVKYNKNKNYRIYDFIEGTMINSWYNFDLEKWEIATKSVVGADCKFIETQETSFSELFYDTCKNCNFSLDLLDKENCYSFVFQHPKNRIVNNITTPNLYLISSYKNNNDNTFEELPYYLFEKFTYSTKLKQPNVYFGDLDKIIESYENSNNFSELDQLSMGVILKECGTNRHVKVKNKIYLDIQKLKMNHTKIDYIYFNLLKNNNINYYLNIFPEHTQAFQKCHIILNERINEIYNLYVEVFIKKNIDINVLEKKHMFHLNRIHKNYINNLRDFGQSTTPFDIYNYIISLPVKNIVYIMDQRFSLNKDLISVNSAITSS